MFRCGVYFERKFQKKDKCLVVGIDEAGRGPLAGPVVAAAVHLKTFKFKNRIDDSKKLTPAQREKAFFEIAEKSAFGIGVVNEKVIDRVNILVATELAMEQAVEGLLEKFPSYQRQSVQLLVDGTVKLNLGLPYLNIIKGDARSKSIAAASYKFGFMRRNRGNTLSTT